MGACGSVPSGEDGGGGGRRGFKSKEEVARERRRGQPQQQAATTTVTAGTTADVKAHAIPGRRKSIDNNANASSGVTFGPISTITDQSTHPHGRKNSSAGTAAAAAAAAAAATAAAGARGSGTFTAVRRNSGTPGLVPVAGSTKSVPMHNTTAGATAAATAPGRRESADRGRRLPDAIDVLNNNISALESADNAENPLEFLTKHGKKHEHQLALAEKEKKAAASLANERKVRETQARMDDLTNMGGVELFDVTAVTDVTVANEQQQRRQRNSFGIPGSSIHGNSSAGRYILDANELSIDDDDDYANVAAGAGRNSGRSSGGGGGSEMGGIDLDAMEYATKGTFGSTRTSADSGRGSSNNKGDGRYNGKEDNNNARDREGGGGVREKERDDDRDRDRRGSSRHDYIEENDNMIRLQRQPSAQRDSTRDSNRDSRGDRDSNTKSSRRDRHNSGTGGGSNSSGRRMASDNDDFESVAPGAWSFKGGLLGLDASTAVDLPKLSIRELMMDEQSRLQRFTHDDNGRRLPSNASGRRGSGAGAGAGGEGGRGEGGSGGRGGGGGGGGGDEYTGASPVLLRRRNSQDGSPRVAIPSSSSSSSSSSSMQQQQQQHQHQHNLSMQMPASPSSTQYLRRNSAGMLSPGTGSHGTRTPTSPSSSSSSSPSLSPNLRPHQQPLPSSSSSSSLLSSSPTHGSPRMRPSFSLHLHTQSGSPRLGPAVSPSGPINALRRPSVPASPSSSSSSSSAVATATAKGGGGDVRRTSIDNGKASASSSSSASSAATLASASSAQPQYQRRSSHASSSPAAPHPPSSSSSSSSSSSPAKANDAYAQFAVPRAASATTRAAAVGAALSHAQSKSERSILTGSDAAHAIYSLGLRNLDNAAPVASPAYFPVNDTGNTNANASVSTGAGVGGVGGGGAGGGGVGSGGHGDDDVIIGPAGLQQQRHSGSAGAAAAVGGVVRRASLPNLTAAGGGGSMDNLEAKQAREELASMSREERHRLMASVLGRKTTQAVTRSSRHHTTSSSAAGGAGGAKLTPTDVLGRRASLGPISPALIAAKVNASASSSSSPHQHRHHHQHQQQLMSVPARTGITIRGTLAPV